MIREDDIKYWMIAITAIVVLVVVVGFTAFIRWGKRDQEQNRIEDSQE